MGNCVSRCSNVTYENIARSDSVSQTSIPVAITPNKCDVESPTIIQNENIDNSGSIIQNGRVDQLDWETQSSSIFIPTSFDFVNSEGINVFDDLSSRAYNRLRTTSYRNDIGLQILKSLIRLEADPNTLTHGDSTCLMFPVMANDLIFTKKLVECGVDINKKDRFGETGLGLAIKLKRWEIAKYLLTVEATDAAWIPCNVMSPGINLLPPSLKSQYDVIFYCISQSRIFFREIASIIALYALSVGYKTQFQRRYITYRAGYDAGPLTIATYNPGAPDFRYALLDFSFRGRCTVRFKINKKSDEMWFGVVGNIFVLDEKRSIKRGRGQTWSYYCGRSVDRYYEGSKPISLAYMMARFKPELNCRGVEDGGYGSLHFPNKVFGCLAPSNTGDTVDLEVDAQEKTFKVIVNGILQASTKAPTMPDQLSFWLELDYTEDEVEFEVLDFSLSKIRKHVGGRISKDKYEK